MTGRPLDSVSRAVAISIPNDGCRCRETPVAGIPGPLAKSGISDNSRSWRIRIAAFGTATRIWWDDRVGDGNDFQTALVELVTERILDF